MMDLLAKQKTKVENAATLYKASRNIKLQTLHNAQLQSKDWISSPKGLVAAFAAGSCYELQSSSESHTSRSLLSILLKFV